MVATVAPAHGADNVVPDNEDSGGPPLPHRGYPMWASKKKISRHLVLGLDGGGPDLGSGLMPGALVTYLNGEQISLLATSIHNRIIDPDPLDSESVDSTHIFI